MSQAVLRSDHAEPEIAVIIVNYGTAELALEAVESVLGHDHGGRGVEVHLVDNASPGGDAARIAAAHAERGWDGRVVLHLEDVNHGFGRGNNVALKKLAERETPPDKVMLLNPDARLKADTLDVVARVLDERPELAVAGCAIERPGNGQRVSAAFRFPGLASEFAAGAVFGPISRALRKYQTACPPDQASGPIDWVSGAAMMVRFDALRQANFFEPAYFLYFEETDLMRRLSRLGWGIWYEAGTGVVHEAGAATGMKSNRTENRALPGYWYESWRTYFLLNHGRGYALATALARMAGWSLNQTVRALQLRRGDGPKGFASMFASHVFWPLLAGRR